MSGRTLGRSFFIPGVDIMKSKQFATAVSATLLALCAATSAQAADWYVGGSLGQASFKKVDVPAGVSADTKDTGYKLLVGAQISPNFAVEGGYADLGKLKATGTDGESLVDGNIKNSGLFVDAVGKLPLAADWGVFGKLGLYDSKSKLGGTFSGADGSNSLLGLKFGVGAEYMVTKTIAVRGEWERSRVKAAGDTANVDLLSVGVTIGF
jgi:OOP family OmpA-OmpF porin